MRLFTCSALPLSLYCILATAQQVIQKTLPNGRPQCTVYASSTNSTDDVPAILSAFRACGTGGDIVFPANQTYTIATRLHATVQDVRIDWRGTWSYSTNLTYWRANSYPISFQNHAAGFILSGDDITIDGHATGGIHGNGKAWYAAEAASPVGDTRPGRPMPFVLWNVSRVSVSNFQVRDPQLWAINIMNGSVLAFANITVNATAPASAPPGDNWIQNTDGFDTMDATGVSLTNFAYQGGDDCVAIKPRSTDVVVRNATCVGGNGVAVGSLGQYLEDASVANVVFDDVRLVRHGWLHGSALIKTWVGVLVNQSSRSYESGWVPRGAGWGAVRNVVFSNFVVEGAEAGPEINQDSGNNGTAAFEGSSLMEVSNVAFVNWTGWLVLDEGERTTVDLSCSTKEPCYNIDFKNVSLTVAENSTDTGVAECRFIEEGRVHGVEGEGC